MGVAGDIRGFIFKIPNEYDIKEIGNKLEDFDILQKLGQGGNGFVIKVRSKKNYKIYAIKRNKELTDKLKREIIILKKLDHPGICKCLNYFEEGGFFYIIMELYDNKDLYRYVDGFSKMGQKIKEENLWDIFNQSLEALTYIHNKGYIHRDIKLANIFMNQDGKVVFGDFGLSAMFDKNECSKLFQEEKDLLEFTPLSCGTPEFAAPEVKKNLDYDQKADVYSLGVCFFCLLYQHFPGDDPKIYEKILLKDKNYDFELIKIVFNMLKQLPNERPNSTEVYQYFKKVYIKKYVANTSIYSIVQCLFSFKNFLDFFSNEISIQYIFETPYQKEVFLILLSIKNNMNNLKEIEESAYALRKKLLDNDVPIKDNVEISPIKVINNILNALYYELNVSEIKSELNMSKIIGIFSDFDKFIKHCDEKFSSIISLNFTGVLKKTLKCQANNCPGENILFQKFNFVNFNVNDYRNYFDPNYPVNIANFFSYYNQSIYSHSFNENLLCKKCYRKTKHLENKKFYCLPKNLIIMLDKTQCNYNIKIEFGEKLYLNDVRNLMNNNNNYEYTLIGVISEVLNMNNGKIKYVSFIKKDNFWILCDNGGGKYVSFNNVQNYGNVISLFYYDEKRDVSIPENNNNNNYGNINNQNMNVNLNNMNNINNNINEAIFNLMFNNTINYSNGNNNSSFNWQMSGNNSLNNSINNNSDSFGSNNSGSINNSSSNNSGYNVGNNMYNDNMNNNNMNNNYGYNNGFG